MAITKKPAAKHPTPAQANDDTAAAAFIAKAGQGEISLPEPEEKKHKVQVTMRYDPDILTQLDDAAKRLGISRSACVHIALSHAFKQEIL